MLSFHFFYSNGGRPLTTEKDTLSKEIVSYHPFLTNLPTLSKLLLSCESLLAPVVNSTAVSREPFTPSKKHHNYGINKAE